MAFFIGQAHVTAPDNLVKKWTGRQIMHIASTQQLPDLQARRDNRMYLTNLVLMCVVEDVFL
jgi:hypothetical protein